MRFWNGNGGREVLPSPGPPGHLSDPGRGSLPPGLGVKGLGSCAGPLSTWAATAEQALSPIPFSRLPLTKPKNK